MPKLKSYKEEGNHEILNGNSYISVRMGTLQNQKYFGLIYDSYHLLKP